MKRCRTIAFYLPQYHPIPENDKWWGTGFTEWRNVVSGTSLFSGHYQPHLPADLGYYDLRLSEIRNQQAILAGYYGIEGFCYYHYWFSGKQLLERPVKDVLNTGEPDFPFCLCWANENWTRRWDGQDKEVLIAQKHSKEDDQAHIIALLPYFQDPRYIRINNKPLFLVYRSSLLPDPVATTTLWRSYVKENGLDGLYIVKVESFPTERERTPESDGFDAALDFQPDWGTLPIRRRPPMISRFVNKLGISWPHPYGANSVYSYPDVVTAMLSRPTVEYPRIPCVVPSWDNTARRRQGGATILHGSTPEIYANWLSGVIENEKTFKKLSEKIVFINAWNEWAEGNHLEPDIKWGHGYLEATRKVLNIRNQL